ncbi:hypothetical protein SCALM49S_08906 [Streptomyces californicus]
MAISETIRTAESTCSGSLQSCSSSRTSCRPTEIRSGSACAMVRTLRRGGASRAGVLSRRRTSTAMSSSRRSASGPVV